MLINITFVRQQLVDNFFGQKGNRGVAGETLIICDGSSPSQSSHALDSIFLHGHPHRLCPTTIQQPVEDNESTMMMMMSFVSDRHHLLQQTAINSQRTTKAMDMSGLKLDHHSMLLVLHNRLSHEYFN